MKLLKRAVSVLLAASFLMILPPQAKAVQANPWIRIGLLYGSSVLPGVNLQNRVGSGYRFGYMDGTTFVEVGRTEETKISMVKNRDVYANGSGEYSDSTVSDTLIGSFHDEYGLQASREAAELLAAELRANGTSAFVYYEKGAWGVRANSYIYNKENAASKKTGSKYCISVVVTNTNNIVFQYDSGAMENPLVIAPDITGIVKPETYFKSYRYTSYFEYTRRDGNDITVVNILTMQDYIKGLVPYEMSASWHIEALKAQALAARSYAVRHLGSHSKDGFDICNETHCQVYYGTGRADANSDRAVDETYGEYITYGGKICDAVYSASSGGATEDAENVWGGKVNYLVGVADIYEDLSRAKDGVWKFETSNTVLTDYLTQKGHSNAGIVNFYVSAFTRMGNVKEVTYVDTAGKKFSFSGSKARSFPGYPSIRYSINGRSAGLTAINDAGTKADLSNGSVWIAGADGQMKEAKLSGDLYVMTDNGAVPIQAEVSVNTTPGVYVVNGRGNGHSVGMSQWGARCMAEKGFTYDQIIKFYYTGVTISKGE